MDLTGAKDPAKRQIPLLKPWSRALTSRCRLAAACVGRRRGGVTGSRRCACGGWLHAVKSPEMVKGWFERFGADALCWRWMSVSTSKATSRWQSAVARELGRFTGTTGGNLSTRRLKHVLCTDISRDGTLAGSNVLYMKKCVPDIRKWRFSPPADWRH